MDLLGVSVQKDKLAAVPPLCTPDLPVAAPPEPGLWAAGPAQAALPSIDYEEAGRLRVARC